MTNLEKRLDAKADLMMGKLDEILSGSNRENRPAPMKDSRRATEESGTHNCAGAHPRSRMNFEPDHRERPRTVPSSSGLTDPTPPETDAPPGARLPTMPQVRSVPDLTTVSLDPTMYASMFEPLNRSFEKFITKLSKSTEIGEISRKTLKKPKSYKDESDGCTDTVIEMMKLLFEEENLSNKQKRSALASNLEGTGPELCNGKND